MIATEPETTWAVVFRYEDAPDFSFTFTGTAAQLSNLANTWAADPEIKDFITTPSQGDQP